MQNTSGQATTCSFWHMTPGHTTITDGVLHGCGIYTCANAKCENFQAYGCSNLHAKYVDLETAFVSALFQGFGVYGDYALRQRL